MTRTGFALAAASLLAALPPARTQDPTPIAAPLADALPQLGEQSSWAQDRRYEGAEPDQAQRGCYPIGNGFVFGHQGLGARANTLQGLTGPQYQTDAVWEPQGHFGAVTLDLLRGDDAVALDAQRVRRVRGAGFVVSEDATPGGGLALRVLTFAPPGAPRLVRIVDVVNAGPADLDDVVLRATCDGTVTADGATLVERYVSEQRPATARYALSGATAGGNELRAAVGTLEAGGRRRYVLWFVTAHGAAPPAAPAADVVARATDEAEATLAWWRDKLADTLEVDTDHAKLRDLVVDWKVMMLAQRCAVSGAVAPMVHYRGAWVRDSVGPMLWFLRIGMWDEAKSILTYFFNATRLQNRVPNHVPLDLDFTALADRVTDWTRVAIPESEVPSWIILQHYWYWRTTRDTALIRAHWPLLEACIKGQRRVDDVLLPFHGDETFLHGALYSVYPDRVGDGSGLIAEDRWRGRKTFSFNASVQFLLALQAIGDLRDEIDREDRPARWKQGTPEDAPGRAYSQRAMSFQTNLEAKFWLEDEKMFAPAISAVHGEPHRQPFANANLVPLWLGWTFARGEKSRDNLRATLAQLWRKGARVGTTPTVGYSTGHLQGMLLMNLAERDGAARLDVLDELLQQAEPAGEWGELVGPDGRPTPAYHQAWPNRCRPWESGVNLDALLYALNGVRYATIPMWDKDDIRTKSRLPHGASYLTMKRVRKDLRALNIYCNELHEPLTPEEREANAKQPPEKRRDPNVLHRRFRLRIEQTSENPPRGYWDVGANGVGTLFVRWLTRTQPIEDKEFWADDHLVFLPRAQAPVRRATALPAPTEGAQRLVFTNRPRGAEISGGAGATVVDTGLPYTAAQLGGLLLKGGAPSHPELLLDWGFDDPGRATFKTAAFWQSEAWTRALADFEAGGGTVLRARMIERYEVAGETIETGPDGRLELREPGDAAVTVRATVTAAAAGEAVLRIGSGCGVVVTLNGEEMIRRSGGRHPLPDQDQALVQLRMGANELQVTLLPDGGRVLYARVTDAKGRPIAPPE